MMGSKLLLLALSLGVLGLTSAFYVHEDAEVKRSEEETSSIQSVGIKYDETEISKQNPYPSSFWIEVESNGEVYNFQFDLVDTEQGNMPIKMWQTDFQSPVKNVDNILSQQGFASYHLTTGGVVGAAILIKNEPGSENAFRVLGNVQIGDNYIEIVPVVTREQSDKRRRRTPEGESTTATGYDGSENTHSITESPLPPSGFDQINQGGVQAEAKKRQVDGRIEYYVELVLVIDSGLYPIHQRYYQTTDQQVVWGYMRMYYAQVVNLVNHFFQNTYANDATANINIVLTNLLYVENPTWTDYNGPCGLNSNRYTVQCSINLFRDLMQSSISMPFTYDMAASISEKDMEGCDGYGYLNAVCTDYAKYVISTDKGAMQCSGVLTHEIGHNLGAGHDDGTDPACVGTDGYIMGVSGKNPNHTYYFSSCTAEQMKQNLATKTCLSNIPVPTPDFTLAVDRPGKYFDATEQCKLRFGPDALFGPWPEGMCTETIWCTTARNATNYGWIGPALHGTPCASGKSCQDAQCVDDPTAYVGTCPFGDRQIIGATNVCDDYLKSEIDKNKLGMAEVCAKTPKCCSTCKKYEQVPKCWNRDIYTCSRVVAANCSSPAKNYKLRADTEYSDAKTMCPFKCGVCSQTATCAQYGSSCLNGATCVDRPKYGFNCICPVGYKGAACEYKTGLFDLTIDQAQNAVTEIDTDPETLLLTATKAN